MATQDIRDQNNDEEEAFKVYVRVRPLNQRELNSNDKRQNLHIIKIQENMVHVYDEEQQYDYTGKRDKMYYFDNAFSEQFSNIDIYNNTIWPLIPNILEGFNVTCFAYGMTGAGKTHTMIGNFQNGNEVQSFPEQGLCFQAINGVFLAMQEKSNQYYFEMKVSYLEIYNEQVRDLLQEKSSNLMIVEDPVKGVIVPDLNEFQVNSSDELASLIFMGNQRRTMAPTFANQVSSRSHAILIFSVEGRDRNVSTKDNVFYSKLQIIDLAGSERAAATDNRGQRMVEGANINRSLLALGNCINILSDKGKTGSFVPYRDSKLTRLLKDSLGGNTKTIMIACISPSHLAFEETVNTLKYASRARNIKRKLQKNVKEVEVHVSRYKEVIDSLRLEIESLRGQLRTQQCSRQSVSPIKSPMQQYQKVPQPRVISQMNSKQRDASSNSKSRKSSFIRPSVNNVNKTAIQQNTHGHTTPVRLSKSYGRQPLITQRQLTYNQNVKETILDQSQSFSIDQTVVKHNVGEIEDEINKIYNEKLKLESEILSDKKSNQGIINQLQNKNQEELEEEMYIQNLSQNLIANFEEHWELKQSIVDLEELQLKNKEQLNHLRQEIQELEQQNMNKFQSLNQLLESQIGKTISAKQNETKILERNHQNNIKILNEMRVALDINLEQKQKLQSMLLKMHSSKRQTLLENVIEMRNLKLEKTDLYLQNLQMKKITQIQQQEKQQTDMKLIEMQKQIEKMQQELKQKDQIIQESQKQLMQKQNEINKIKIVDQPISNLQQNHKNHKSDLNHSKLENSYHKNQNLLFSCDNNDFSQKPYDSRNSTVKIDFQSTLKDQVMTRYQQHQNQSSAPNSARLDSSKNGLQQTAQINKKLVLSGFFEDDFQGELEKEEGRIQEINHDILSEPNYEYGNQTSILQTKRQSQDVVNKVNPSNIKSRKGYTPNNRYNAGGDYENEEDDMQKSLRSSIQMNFNIDGSLERDQSQSKQPIFFLQNNSQKDTPVAQVDLYQASTQKSEKIQLYQPKIQTSNQRYQNHQPDINSNTSNIKNTNSTQSTNNYDSRRNNKSNNKKSSTKRTSKLNRYLSFNRKETEDKQVQEQQTQQSHLKAVPYNNHSKELLRDQDYIEFEKENSYPKNNINNTQHIDIYNTISADARNGHQKAISPPQHQANHTIDLRQIQNNKDLHIPSNKFEQRKYSQPIVSSNPQNKQQLNKTPQNTGSRRPPSPGLHNTSTISGVSNGIQSYAQIRRQSKERQQQQQQQLQNSQIHQTPIQNNNSSLNPYTQRKQSMQNTHTDKRQSTGYNSHKIDLSNQNNSNKYKASATATISRYGPIKPTYSQNQINCGNQQNQSSNAIQNEITQGFGIGQTYFENFIKKKNSFVNFNSLQQQQNNMNQTQQNLGGPTRATNNFNGLLMNNSNSNNGNGGPTAIKVFSNTQSPMIQSQNAATNLNSNQNSYRQQNINNTQNNLTQQIVPNTLQISQLDQNKISGQKKNTKSSSINIQSLDELLMMNQTNSVANFTSVNPSSTTSKLNKGVDDLINRQKAQLSKDKEKLEKNHKFFTNSFASTLNNNNNNQQQNSNQNTLIQNPQQPLLQTERVYDTNKFATNSFVNGSSNNNGSLSGRTQNTSSNALLSNDQQQKGLGLNYSTNQQIPSKLLHSQRYQQQQQSSTNTYSLNKHLSHNHSTSSINNINNHGSSSNQLNPCSTVGLSNSNSNNNLINIDDNNNLQSSNLNNNKKMNTQILGNNLNSQRNRYQESSINDDFIILDDKQMESPAKRVYLLSDSSDNALNLLPS